MIIAGVLSNTKHDKVPGQLGGSSRLSIILTYKYDAKTLKTDSTGTFSLIWMFSPARSYSFAGDFRQVWRISHTLVKEKDTVPPIQPEFGLTNQTINLTRLFWGFV